MSENEKSDGELADAVMNATDNLNAAIVAAVSGGLRVDVDYRTKFTYDGENVSVVEVNVYKPLWSGK